MQTSYPMMPARESLEGGMPHEGDLRQFCASDAWSGELDTGLFHLSATTRQILGLKREGSLGLLTLIQCFDPADHHHLIDLFERAATEPMRFSFSTTIVRKGQVGQTLFCIGQSGGHGEGSVGSLAGIFIFPHL